MRRIDIEEIMAKCYAGGHRTWLGVNNITLVYRARTSVTEV